MIETVSNLIGSPIEKDQKKIYLDMFEKSQKYFQLKDFHENSIYSGPVDYLSVISGERNNSYDENLTKRYIIQWEFGRGKIYSGKILVPFSSEYVIVKRDSTDLDFEKEGHKKFIQKYLDTNNWTFENPIGSFFSGHSIYSKDNIELDIWPAMRYAFIIQINRKDLPELNKELDKIHQEAKKADVLAEEKINEARNKAKFQ